MKEIKQIIQAYNSRDKELSYALATVFYVKDSSYRRPGARMLICENGQWTGGISGGCLEGDALRRAQKVMHSKNPEIVQYDTRDGDPHQIGVGLGCSGLIEILIAPLDDTNANNPIFQLEAIINSRKPKIKVSLINGTIGAFSSGSMFDPETILKELQKDQSKTQTSEEYGYPIEEITKDIDSVYDAKRSMVKNYKYSSNEIGLFIEFIEPQTRLIICGQNYDVPPLLKIANELGWETIMVANISKLSKSIFSLPSRLIDKSMVGTISCDSYTACMMMTHDLVNDAEYLKCFLPLEPSYIGLLGPAKRRIKLMDLLLKEGINPDDFQTEIYGPTGLDTGASTPEEIAISILAEIRTHFSGRDGKHLRERDKPIYFQD